MAKPGRSEEADVDAEQQLRSAEAVRQMFTDQAPKHPPKPSRSDDASLVSSLPSSFEGPISEHVKLQQLLVTSPGQILTNEPGGDVPSEYVETNYYKELHDADQTLHHTTGTGFIQVETNRVLDLSALQNAPIVRKEGTTTGVDFETPEEFVETEYYNDLSAVHEKALHHTTGTGYIKTEKNGSTFTLNVTSTLARTTSGCNPAMNDWVPVESTTTVVCTSEKPGRSES